MNVVCLPWPNRLLSPNARVHHMLKGKITRSSRAAVALIASQGHKTMIARPSLAVIPIVTTRRRRDIDNVLASLKASIDGLTDAGWWSDDSELQSITVRRPLYARLWPDNQIVIVASESSSEDVMLRRISVFCEEAPLHGVDAMPHLTRER